MNATQQAFAQALLDPAEPCPGGLRVWNGSDPSRRFAVYRNNVVTSLVDALAETFPVVRELVGDEVFAGMARLYATRSPPTDPVLAWYGSDFAEFIEQFEPAQRVPYLADVARLERLRVSAFHAADAPALSAADIGRHLSDPRGLGASMPRLHPSVAVLASAYAIVSLWAAHQGAGELWRVDPMLAECALVLRQDDEVLVIAVAPETAALVRHMQGGATLAGAVTAAAACGGGFDLSGSLALLIRHGAIVAWHPARRPEP